MQSERSVPRVLHVAPVLFGDQIGGGERYPLELARAMARRVPTSLLGFGARPRRERIGELEVRVLRNWIDFRRLRFDPLNPLMLGPLAHADIIHCHQTERMIASVSLLYARLFRKPIFTTHLGGAGYGLHRVIDVTRWYNGHLHISEFSRRNFGHERLAAARVVLGGVDTERFKPAGERTDEVLYVGRILPHKGINYLIDAVGDDTQLIIIGRSFRFAQRYLDDLQRMSARKKVRFELSASDADIVRAYQRALCIVLPSVHKTVYGELHPIPELLGLTLIEGMACGVPAICTDVTSLPEVVEHGVTGFVVPPNDAAALRERISWLRNNPAGAELMGKAARERVMRKFTWDAVVDRCLDAYGIGVRPPDPAKDMALAADESGAR